MTLSRRISSGAAWQIGARLYSSLVSFVITAVLLARVLSEAEYGIFNFYLTAFLLAMTLADFGANRAAIRLVAAGRIDLAPAVRAASAFKLRVGVGIFAALSAIAISCESGFTDRALLVLASAHALAHGLSAASVGYEVAVSYRVPALSVLAGYSWFLLAGLALFAAAQERAAPYLLAYGVALVVQNAVLWLGSRPARVSRETHREALRELFREALPLGISAVSVSIYYYADTLMLRPLRGEEDVAEYSVAYRLMTFALMVPVLFSQVLFPVLTRCRLRSAQTLQIAVRRAVTYLACVAAAALALIAVRSGDLLQLVFGGDYARAAGTLRVLALGMACVFLTYPHTTALIAAGHAAVFTRITLVSALVNVGLNLAMIPALGPLGAAFATFATEAVVLVLGAAALFRIERVAGASPELLKALAVFLAVLGVLLAPPLRDAPVLVSVVATAVVVFLLARAVRLLPFDLGVDEAHLEPEAPA